MNPYFGEVGDVWKHLLLAEVLPITNPVVYVESHSGCAVYDYVQSPERDAGVRFFLENAKGELASSNYRLLLAEHRFSSLREYPGSPLIALSLGHSTDRYVFCDTDPQAVGNLLTVAGDFSNKGLIDAQLADGPTTVMRLIVDQRLGSDGMVFIDPFEPERRLEPSSPNSLDLAVRAASSGCCVAFWYSYSDSGYRAWPVNRLTPTTGVSWAADLMFTGRTSGMVGCGVWFANIDSSFADIASRLGHNLVEMYQGLAARGTPAPGHVEMYL